MTFTLELKDKTKQELLESIRNDICYRVGRQFSEKYANEIDAIVENDIASTATMIKEALTTMNGNSFVDEIRNELQSALVKRSVQLASGLIDKAFDNLKKEPLFNEKLKIKVHEVVTEYLNEYKLRNIVKL